MSSMICDACGEILTVQPDGNVKCSGCGMEYTAEYIELKNKIETKEKALAEAKNTIAVNKKVKIEIQKKITQKQQGMSIGVYIMVISFMCFILSNEKSVTGVIISILVGILGLIFAATNEITNSEYKVNERTTDNITNATNQILMISEEISELKKKLEELN